MEKNEVIAVISFVKRWRLLMKQNILRS